MDLKKEGQRLECIKFCKFLAGTDILVSTDLHGWIHFWCVTTAPHPRKNTCLLSVLDDEKSDRGQTEAFSPIRAIDYDPEAKVLYTGDEAGYMNKWDVSGLVDKCARLKPKDDFDPTMTEAEKEIFLKERAVKQKSQAFHLTQPHAHDDVVFTQEDAHNYKDATMKGEKHRWQAHQDYITSITFVPELNVVSSCSFDKNVFMWDKTTCLQVGSLVLGTGTTQNSEISEAERRRFAKVWQIKIDKRPRLI